MIASMHRPKRFRSPTPPEISQLDISSPISKLVKRRRKTEDFSSNHDSNQSSPSHLQSGEITDHSSPYEQEDTVTNWDKPSVNGRRRRQWEILNAPSSSSSSSLLMGSQSSIQHRSNGNGNLELDTKPLHQLKQEIEDTMNGNGHVNGNENGNENGDWDEDGNVITRGMVNGRYMSSSPIRHDPPGSSPFKSQPASRNVEQEEMEGWQEDELPKEWGEYAAENSLLYNLHRARTQQPPPPPQPHSRISRPAMIHSSSTSSIHSVTSQTNPFQHPNMFTPSRPLDTNNANNEFITPSIRNPTDTLSQYRNPVAPPSSSSTQFPSSSPFTSASTRINKINQESEMNGSGNGDDMEVLMDITNGRMAEGGEEEGDGDMNDDDRRRYEEANKLLADLAVERRRRWGEG